MKPLPLTRPCIDEAAIAAVSDVLRSGWLTSGAKVRQLEAQLSHYCAGRPVRTTHSGTSALELALRLCHLGPGDEVITTPMSWVATANVILRVGAKPVFVDVDPLSRNLDPGKIPAAITPRTRAILPVDMAGNPADRDAIYAIARAHGLRVIEDAAQSLGAHWQHQPIGQTGDLVAFSFHANKNITSGEGGCLVMTNEDDVKYFEKLRLQGISYDALGKMDVDTLGSKHLLTDLAAALCLSQLPQLEAFTQKRRTLAACYFAEFDRSLGCQLPPDNPNTNWHMFCVRLPLATMNSGRATLIAAMAQAGISTGTHYPAIHLFSLYRQLGYQPGDFPVAEAIAQDTLTLPMFVDMTTADVTRVCQTLSATLRPLLT